MRIAALFSAEDVSGPGRQLAALAAGLAKAGVDLRVIQLWRTGHPRPAFLDYLRNHGVSAVPIEDRGPLDLGLMARAGRVLNDWAPDVIQSHGYKANALAWSLRRKGVRLPWVGFFHGATNESRRASVYHWLDHQILRSADRIIVMSSRQAMDFRRVAPKVRVIYNSVVPLPLNAEQTPVALPPRDPTRPRLAVVGRLSPEKGVDVFLHACAILRSRSVRFDAVIVGDGPERDRLEQLHRDLELASTVTFLGVVQDVGSVYRDIDLLAIPSRSEGLPNVLLEALACDVPVVATDVGAIGDVLTDSRGGRIVAPGSASDLADAIAAALVECRGPEAMEACQAMAARFSMEARIAQHRELYTELLTGNAPQRSTA